METVWVVQDGDKVAVTEVRFILPSIKITYSGFVGLVVELTAEHPTRREYKISYSMSPGGIVQTVMSIWTLVSVYREPTHF